MGRSENDTAANEAITDGTSDAQRRRFASYFPKVFAYAHSWTNDEVRSREIVIEAFARAFSRGLHSSEDDFAVVLFSVTRDLCSGARSCSAPNDTVLTDPERDVLALLFDAQLTRRQVGSLLTMPEESVVTTLVNGLRKLKRVLPSGSKATLQQS